MENDMSSKPTLETLASTSVIVVLTVIGFLLIAVASLVSPERSVLTLIADILSLMGGAVLTLGVINLLFVRRLTRFLQRLESQSPQARERRIEELRKSLETTLDGMIEQMDDLNEDAQMTLLSTEVGSIRVTVDEVSEKVDDVQRILVDPGFRVYKETTARMRAEAEEEERRKQKPENEV